MLLQIFTTDGNCVCTTEFETCSYDLDTLRSMSKAGYTFRIDGKRVSFGNISQKVTASFRANAPKETQSVTASESLKDIPPAVVETADLESNLETAAMEVEIVPPAEPAVSRRAVRCVETGSVWASQSAAAKELGIDPSYISAAIKSGQPYKGMTFEKVVK